MSNILDMFKGIGNTPEIGRILWFMGGLSMMFYAGWSVVANKEPFLPHCLEFGGGFAALLAAGGFGISQKDNGVANAKATTAAAGPTSVQVDTVKGDIKAENVSVGNTTD